MKYSLKRLSNNLRILTVPMPSLDSATVTVWIKTGSRFEAAGVNGISHFLEHIVFKGSKKRPSAKAISVAVDAMGGEFNAGTGKECTNFYIKARKDNLEKAFDILSDMIINPLMDEREIEREKGVICQELSMYEDTPMIKIFDEFESTVYKGNPLAWDIGGSEKTVRSIKRSDFDLYRKSHYYTDNMLVSVAGGVSESEVLKLAEKYFSGLNDKKDKSTFEKFKVVQDKPQISVKNKKNEQAHLMIGFRALERTNEQRYVESVLASVLGYGMSSRLFTEVRERRGLAYAVKTAPDATFDTGYLATYEGVDPKKVEEAVKVTLNEYYALASKAKPIDQKEFTKAKEMLKGALALSLEDTRDAGNFFAEQELLKGYINSPEEVYKKVDAVKVEEVYALAKELFTPQRLNFSLIGPFAGVKQFEKLIK
jgi:predicted Zn-dependent peptidase